MWFIDCLFQFLKKGIHKIKIYINHKLKNHPMGKCLQHSWLYFCQVHLAQSFCTLQWCVVSHSEARQVHLLSFTLITISSAEVFALAPTLHPSSPDCRSPEAEDRKQVCGVSMRRREQRERKKKKTRPGALVDT